MPIPSTKRAASSIPIAWSPAATLRVWYVSSGRARGSRVERRGEAWVAGTIIFRGEDEAGEECKHNHQKRRDGERGVAPNHVSEVSHGAHSHHRPDERRRLQHRGGLPIPEVVSVPHAVAAVGGLEELGSVECRTSPRDVGQRRRARRRWRRGGGREVVRLEAEGGRGGLTSNAIASIVKLY